MGVTLHATVHLILEYVELLLQVTVPTRATPGWLGFCRLM